jgi:hypothetical protein
MLNELSVNCIQQIAMEKMIRYLRTLTGLGAFALLFAATGSLHAQQTGPLKAPATPPVVRVPLPTEKLEAPAIPPEEIIKRFAAKEDEFLQASADYNFRKTARLEELGPGNRPSGQVEITTEQVVGPDGRRYEKIVNRSESTLTHMDMQRGDLGIIDAAPLFPLTTGQLPRYELTYQGKQSLDELNVYIFGVKPRVLDRTHAYFSGVVWVDEQDLVIVKTIGKWVSETGDVMSKQLPFTIFETYREQVGKYWFPTYSRSEDSFDQGGVSVPIRLTIRWTDYKLGTTAAPSPTPAAAK